MDRNRQTIKTYMCAWSIKTWNIQCWNPWSCWPWEKPGVALVHVHAHVSLILLANSNLVSCTNHHHIRPAPKLNIWILPRYLLRRLLYFLHIRMFHPLQLPSALLLDHIMPHPRSRPHGHLTPGMCMGITSIDYSKVYIRGLTRMHLYTSLGVGIWSNWRDRLIPNTYIYLREVVARVHIRYTYALAPWLTRTCV